MGDRDDSNLYISTKLKAAVEVRVRKQVFKVLLPTTSSAELSRDQQALTVDSSAEEQFQFNFIYRNNIYNIIDL